MSASINVPNEAVEIDVDSLETSAGRLICTIKPNWVSKKLTVKKLGTDDNIIYYSIYPGDDEDEQHGVVIKLYPANSDLYTDWQTELRLIEELVHLKIAPQVILTFNNGYFSNYVLGKTLNIKEEHAQQLVARKLAEFHSIPLKSDNSPKFIDKLKRFIDLFTNKNVALQDRLFDIKVQSEEAAVKNPSFFNSLKSAIGLNPTSTSPPTVAQLELQLKDTSWAELSTDIDFIRSILEDHWSKHGLPVVLCLNNMNIHNFLYDNKNKTMSIIDFDHCSYNYVLTDIVSYFLELAHDDPENKYPQRHVQKLFLIEYLKNSSLNLSNIVYDPLKPTDNELDHLCDLCGLLIAPIHLYWALWAFLQALLTKPTSTFDYINYGKTRLAQYQKNKPNFFLPLYNPQTNSYRYK